MFSHVEVRVFLVFGCVDSRVRLRRRGIVLRIRREPVLLAAHKQRRQSCPPLLGQRQLEVVAGHRPCGNTTFAEAFEST